MTRVNCGIPPRDLTRQHLIAEHREIKRIPNVVSKGKYDLIGQPQVFKLGAGHVKFFYNKLGYLKERYEELYSECRRRGYDVSYYGDAWNGVPDHLMCNYQPTKHDVEIITERINLRNKGK
jgi:hypothetical protein